MNKQDLIEKIENRLRFYNQVRVMNFAVNTESVVPQEWREDICLHFKGRGNIRFDDEKKQVWLERKSIPL